MKTHVILLLILLLGFISCKKEDEDSIDYRDIIVGEYIGIRIDCQLSDEGGHISRDTSDLQINLTKSESDSLIKIAFTPGNLSYKFKYSDGKFRSIMDYRPPTLIIEGDSLSFHYQSGIGPVWMDCNAKKER
jgi:hypothetical protein